VLGGEQSLEPVQLAGYLVLLVITVRILRATNARAPGPAMPMADGERRT
jgi:hypothetical protein